MSPAASRPSAVMPPRLLERIFPLVPKLVSRLPLALKRARAPWVGANLFCPCLAEPATRILPSGWTSTAAANSWAPCSGGAKNSVLARPPAPKLVSRLPSALNLATANSKVPPPGKPGFDWLPAQRIFPSGWMATPVPLSPAPPKPADARPPVPNAVSSFPVGR
jgi:hypothetical protein